MSALVVDGDTVTLWPVYIPADPYYRYYIATYEDFPYTFTTPGFHTVQMVHDARNSLAEGNELDNSCERTIFVRCVPGEAVGTGIGVLGYPLGYKNHIDTYCNGSTHLMIDKTRRRFNNIHGHSGYMDNNDSIITYSYTGLPVDSLMVNVENYWDASYEAAGVDAHVYAGWTYDYLWRVLGRNGINDSGLTMPTVVEYGPESDRAQYSGGIVRVWRPSTGRRSYAGCVEVIAHEWGHGVTAFTSALAKVGECGALNESFSDMLGVSVGFATDDPDWLGGENSYLGSGADRSLLDPPAYGQPDTYHGRYWSDFGDVHINMGVPNKMFYLFAVGGTHNGISISGIGIDSAMMVMYETQRRRYWRDTTNFSQAMYGSLQAAEVLRPGDPYYGGPGPWVPPLLQAWEAVKVCVPNGDLNQSGYLEYTDVELLLKCVFEDYLSCDQCHADVNCSGRLSGSDVVALLRMYYQSGRSACPYSS